MSHVKLRGADLTRPTSELRAETGASYQAIAAARRRAGVPPTHPEKSRMNPGRSRRPKVERPVKVAPVVVQVVEVSVVGPTLCRRRSEEEWEREPVFRRTDR